MNCIMEIRKIATFFVSLSNNTYLYVGGNQWKPHQGETGSSFGKSYQRTSVDIFLHILHRYFENIEIVETEGPDLVFSIDLTICPYVTQSIAKTVQALVEMLSDGVTIFKAPLPQLPDQGVPIYDFDLPDQGLLRTKPR